MKFKLLMVYGLLLLGVLLILPLTSAITINANVEYVAGNGATINFTNDFTYYIDEINIESNYVDLINVSCEYRGYLTNNINISSGKYYMNQTWPCLQEIINDNFNTGMSGWTDADTSAGTWSSVASKFNGTNSLTFTSADSVITDYAYKNIAPTHPDRIYYSYIIYGTDIGVDTQRNAGFQLLNTTTNIYNNIMLKQTDRPNCQMTNGSTTYTNAYCQEATYLRFTHYNDYYNILGAQKVYRNNTPNGIYDIGNNIINLTGNSASKKPITQARVNSIYTGNTGTNVEPQVYFDDIKIYKYEDAIFAYLKDFNTGAYLANFSVNLYNSTGNYLGTYDSNSTYVNNFAYVILPNYDDDFVLEYVGDGYLTKNNTVTFSGTNLEYTATTFEVPRINVSFYDEISRDPLSNVSYKLIFSDDTATSHDSGSSVSADIKLNSTGELEIEYTRDGYFLRHYYVNVTEQTNTSINLYLLNESGTNNELVTFTITDVDGTELEGATLKVLRRYIEDETAVFETVQMEKSDLNGEGGVYLQLYDATYKFIVEYDGNVILLTSPEQVITNSIRLRGSLTSSVITSSIATTGLLVSGVWNPSSLIYSFTYTDPYSITDSVCVEITKTTGRAIQEINSSCVDGITGSIDLGVPNSTGTYRVYAYQITNTAFSDKSALNSGFTISDVKETIGISGIFYLLMFTVMGALVGLMVFQNTTGTLALTAVGFVVGVMFKVTEFGWVAAMTVISIVGVSIWATRKLGGSGS